MTLYLGQVFAQAREGCYDALWRCARGDEETLRMMGDEEGHLPRLSVFYMRGVFVSSYQTIKNAHPKQSWAVGVAREVVGGSWGGRALGGGRRQDGDRTRTVAGGGKGGGRREPGGRARKVVGWPWGLHTPLHPLFTSF
jgi:hypothetical protein